MEGTGRSTGKAVRDGRHGCRCRRGDAEHQAGVVRDGGHAEQSAATSDGSFSAGIGVVIGCRALIVMVVARAGMGMSRALMRRRRAHRLQFAETMERSRPGDQGDRDGGSQNAKRIGQSDENRRPRPEAFRQTPHRAFIYIRIAAPLCILSRAARDIPPQNMANSRSQAGGKRPDMTRALLSDRQGFERLMAKQGA